MSVDLFHPFDPAEEARERERRKQRWVDAVDTFFRYLLHTTLTALCAVLVWSFCWVVYKVTTTPTNTDPGWNCQVCQHRRHQKAAEAYEKTHPEVFEVK